MLQQNEIEYEYKLHKLMCYTHRQKFTENISNKRETEKFLKRSKIKQVEELIIILKRKRDRYDYEKKYGNVSL